MRGIIRGKGPLDFSLAVKHMCLRMLFQHYKLYIFKATYPFTLPCWVSVSIKAVAIFAQETELSFCNG